jgi:hypothetical protein
MVLMRQTRRERFPREREGLPMKNFDLGCFQVDLKKFLHSLCSLRVIFELLAGSIVMKELRGILYYRFARWLRIVMML